MGIKLISEFVTQIFETNSVYSEWFGYYNYSPFSVDNQRILCHRADIDSIPETKGHMVELGYYTIHDKKWHHIGYSDSWNWQQGAMLQWIPNHDDLVIYNCSKNNHLIAKIHNISTGEEKELNFPIYGLTPDGKHSISIDLERSFWCRAYHYQSVANEDKEGRIYDGDGIFDIDIEKNSCKRIISIQDVINIDYDVSFEQKKHWLEHVMISPSGNRFCFLHRFSSIENVNDYKTRLCIANIDGSNIQIIQGWKTLDWSHFGWCTDDSFVIYTYKRGIAKDVPSIRQIMRKQPYNLPLLFFRVLTSSIVRLPKRVRKLLLRESTYYQFYAIDKRDCFTLTNIYDNLEFDIDGHPSFDNSGLYMITDTYPDKNNEQHLYLFNRETLKVTDLVTLSAKVGLGNESCDLHPKFSFDKLYVSVDSDYKGRRKVLCFIINWGKIIQNN